MKINPRAIRSLSKILANKDFVKETFTHIPEEGIDLVKGIISFNDTKTINEIIKMLIPLLGIEDILSLSEYITQPELSIICGINSREVKECSE